MKKIITLSLVIGAIMMSNPISSYAGDREWATAGKVLAGVVGVGLVASAINHDRYGYHRGPVYTSSYYGPRYSSYHYGRSTYVRPSYSGCYSSDVIYEEYYY